MGEIVLHPDQAVLVDQTREAMRQTKAVIVQQATGGGKTIIAAHMIQRACERGSRALFLVPRRELLRQTVKTFQRYDIPHGVIAAGYNPNGMAQVQVATVGTLARRLDRARPANVVFVDEAHYGGGEQADIIAHYRNGGAWIIGLTATPVKAQGKGMSATYERIICGPQVSELIAKGRLSRYRLFAPDKPDLSGIATVMGDYAPGQLATRMEADRVLTGNAVKHYLSHAPGKLCLVFCTSVRHAQIVAEAFQALGVSAASIDGSMDDVQRAKLIKAFARREIMVLTSCNLLTFGFDLASAAEMDVTVEAISDMRPTQSEALQRQKWGRALRQKPEPAIILDHAGNCEFHGLPDDWRDWTLDDKPKKSVGAAQKTTATMQCPAPCYNVHRPSPECPRCGFVYPPDAGRARMVDEVDGELAEVQAGAETMVKKQEQGRARSLEDLIRVGKARGMKNPHGWAKHVLAGRK